MFDTFGHLVEQPRVLSAMLWTTRWMKDEEAQDSIMYALDPRNEITPIGRSLALWGQFVQSDMVAVQGCTDQISAFASRSHDGKQLVVWVLNRDYTPVDNLTIILQGQQHYRATTAYRFSGSGSEDANPRWEQIPPPGVEQKSIKFFPAPAYRLLCSC